MKKAISLILASAMCICMFSCGRGSSRSVFSDKYKDYWYTETSVDGICHGIESYFRCPYIFIGEFTGETVKNTDGLLYKKFHKSL